MKVDQMMPVVGLDELEGLAVDLTDVEFDQVVNDEDVAEVMKRAFATIRFQLLTPSVVPFIESSMALTAVTEYFLTSFVDEEAGTSRASFEVMHPVNRYVLNANFSGLIPGVGLTLTGIGAEPSEDISWKDGVYFIAEEPSDSRYKVFLPVLHTDLYLSGDHRFN